MILLKKLTASIAIAATALLSQAFTVGAQTHRTPSSHNQQHSQLLAAQRPIAADIKLVNPSAFIEGLRGDDADDFADSDIYTEHWGSDAVNPYNGADIPEIKDLDVSSYVSPLENIRVTSNFGFRRRFGRMHKGIDLGLHVGDTVRAAFDGKVRLCRFQRGGYGYYVVIRHDNGMETVYGHLSKFIVKPDQRVRAGDPIALGGNTGLSTGPHLHFETRFMGIAINPATIFDMEAKMPLSATFTFERATHEKLQKYTPGSRKYKASKKKRRSTASRKRRRR